MALLLIVIAVSFYAGFLGTSSADSSDLSVATASAPAAAPPASPIQQTSDVLTTSRLLGPSEPSALPSGYVSSPLFPGSFISGTAAQAETEEATSSVFSSAEDQAACEPSGNPLYCVYTVQPGDILSEIAAEFGLSGSEDLTPAEMLAESNKPAVAHPDAIVSGLRLRIPVQNGIIHTILVSETLADIAARYGVSESSIASLELNGISDSDLLHIGQELLIPDPVGIFRRASEPPASLSGLSQPEASSTPEPDVTETPDLPEPTPTTPPVEPSPAPEETQPVPTATAVPPEATPTPTSTPEPEDQAEETTPAPTPVRRGSTCLEYETAAPSAAQNRPSAAGFIWPALGPLSSCFGPAHPLGIDIDLFAEPNQVIRASAAGVVTFAGGDPCCSYGYYVVIDHGGGFATLYAHFSAIGVSEGQFVSQGEFIGIGGRSGFATGNHLHFEILYEGEPVDPLPFLP